MLLSVAVPLACVLAVLGPSPVWAGGLFCVPLLLVAVVWLVPPRVSEWDVVTAAGARDLVHSEEFPDLAQRRRARVLCTHFVAVRDAPLPLDPKQVAHVEALLWQALVALRDSLVVRDALSHAENRPGLVAAIAEPTRALSELDRRVDQFADALRILVEESDPELAGTALRRVAALDPL